MRKQMILILLSMAASLLLAEPKTIYVDQSVAASGDGTSWATAVKTIQEGVNKASTTEVDTVLVAPGEYADEPGNWSNKLYYRVKLDRKVILKSSEGKEKTHIVGRRGNGKGENDPVTGLPPVSCVYIPNEGKGSIVEGFTIRDGESAKSAHTSCRSAGVGNPTLGGNGNYALALEPDKFWYVAYCTISNCCAERGSAISGGTLIGSVVADNVSWGSIQAAVSYVHAYNCVFTRNATSAKRGGAAYALVNCLVVNDLMHGMTGVPSGQGGDGYAFSHFYNTAMFNECGTSTGDTWSGGNPCCADCIVDSDANGAMYLADGSERTTPIPVESTYTNLVMNLLTDDWRPIKGGALDGKGGSAALDLAFIPAEYARRDFYGNELADGAPIPIGLILPTVEPATAAIVPAAGMKVNGRLVRYERNAFYAEKWPTVVEFSAADGEEDYVAGIFVSAYAGEGGYRKYCGKYDFVPLTMPPRTDAAGNELPALVIGRVGANPKYVYYVDDDAAFEGEADGSSDKPYPTIQAAVDAASQVENQPFSIINVRKGTYKTGSKKDATGLQARIVIPSKGNFLIRGVDGADQTFVEGEPDPDLVDDATYMGVGPKAVRCVYAPSNANVGFANLTFRKGYGGNTAATASGGALYVAETDVNNPVQAVQAYDCVFTDNHICKEITSGTRVQRQGSCCYCGWTVRCRFTGNARQNRGFVSYTVASGCLFDNNSTGIKDETYGMQAGWLYNCTFYEPGMASTCRVLHNTALAVMENGIIAAGGNEYSAGTATAGAWCHNLLWGLKTYADPYDEDQFLKTDPWLAAEKLGNYHPVEGSPAIGFADFNRDAAGLGRRLRNTCTDFENKSVFTADGKVTVGAFATVYEKSNVYVDATNGNDANDGRSEAGAKKTLAAAAGSMCRTDTLIALPGTYKDGDMIQTVSSTGRNVPFSVRARVVVPDGSTLVSRDGAETTIIEGAADSNPPTAATAAEKEHGLGPNAIRGVVLGAGSVLRGFTVTKGHTRHYDSTEGYSDNIQGAGVLGRSTESSRVEDCIIRENESCCGGGGSYVTFVRCRILDNVATRFASVLRIGSMINCFADGNCGPRTCDVVQDVLGCTFGADNFAYDGESPTMTIRNEATATAEPVRVWNVLCYAPPASGNLIPCGDVRNCVVPSGFVFQKDTSGAALEVVNVNDDYSQADLAALYDENGVPKGVEVPSVDVGCAAVEEGETDLAGNPRVLNGIIDIGCYEADWRAVYAKDLGGRRATVTKATSGVRDVDGAVVLADGAELALNLAADGYGVKIAFTVTDGTLTVMRNGALLGTYTAGETLSIADTANLESFAFGYAGTGNAQLTCCRARPGALMIIR